jgi:hypothetical protein
MGIDGKGPGRVLFFGRGEKGGYCFERHLAGDIARLMTAHSIGNQIECVFVEDKKGILIVFALKPYISHPNRRYAHFFQPKNLCSKVILLTFLRFSYIER